ncbi:MAG: hypothetical protein COB53_01925 [Elusimicrobia bacterium]|nr:MAG: hypothetical protein COB53_01925 [Elusimicrobiota bacterium]
MAARFAVILSLAAFSLFACRAPDGIPAQLGRVVTLHYTLKSGDAFAASTETKGAVTVRLGNNDGLLVGLRKGLLGMKPGEERAFNIAPEEGFSDGPWKGILLQARVKIEAVRIEEK